MIPDLIKTKHLYHYTGFDALFAILESFHKNSLERKFVFWASNVYNVNDTKEMDAGYDAVKRFLSQYEIKNVPRERWLSDVYNNLEYERACKEDYLYGRSVDTAKVAIIPYIMSLSKRRDYLPMWSMYGNKGKGVCLVFDACLLIDMLPSNYLIESVVYEKRKETEMLNELIPFAYKNYMLQYKKEIVDISIELKTKELATICLYVAPFFKYNDYQYEKEIRIVDYVFYGQDLSTFPYTIIKENIIKKHNDIPIPVDALKGIIIGPDADYDVMKHILELELNDCRLMHIDIMQSKIAYRSK